MKKLQEAIIKIEEWSFKWGFKFSIDKIMPMFFARKIIVGNLKLRLCDQELDRVQQLKFLGLRFDERITWNLHIQKLERTSLKTFM